MILTESQQRIVEMIVLGRSNCEIAVAMKRSEKTIKNSVSRILMRNHVLSRTELAVKAVVLGVVKVHLVNDTLRLLQ